MINYSRVKRIKSVIYAVLLLMFFLPLILVIALCIRISEITNMLEQVDNTMQSAATAFDRAIAGYRAPRVELSNYAGNDGADASPDMLDLEPVPPEMDDTSPFLTGTDPQVSGTTPSEGDITGGAPDTPPEKEGYTSEPVGGDGASSAQTGWQPDGADAGLGAGDAPSIHAPLTGR